MKAKKLISTFLVLSLSLSFSGCRKKEAETSAAKTPEPTPVPTPTPDPYAAPAGTYFSELTGEPIDEKLKDQRPLAVMIDCETLAFPHYGTAKADVVYELMNNVYNGRITRFMALYKDYMSVPQIGSIRSARTTNVWLAGEWNAILCHDGQARVTSEYFGHDYATQHFSGFFSRINNGKNWEFTEYVTPGDLEGAFEQYGVDQNYNQYKQEGDHFNFVRYTTEKDTSSLQPAVNVQLPYPHNKSALAYNDGTKTYDFYMYDALHQDAETNETLTFKNVLLLDCSYTQYPTDGNIYYNCQNVNHNTGWYLTDGKVEQITWSKGGENTMMQYFDAEGKPLEMNRGKTYITLVPEDVWDQVVIQ